jgi:hypothetical protein
MIQINELVRTSEICDVTDEEATEVMGGAISAGTSLAINGWVSYSNGTPFNWQTSLGSAAISGAAGAIKGGLWGAKLAG